MNCMEWRYFIELGIGMVAILVLVGTLMWIVKRGG